MKQGVILESRMCDRCCRDTRAMPLLRPILNQVQDDNIGMPGHIGESQKQGVVPVGAARR
jgi:hypothetical protein